jgi:integrin alpha FG-GAP repeat containing protein 1
MLILFPACLFVFALQCAGLEPEGRLNKATIGLPEHGRIMAVGHFIQERELDLFIRGADLHSFSIWKWIGKGEGGYRQHLEIKDVDGPIVNMVASDFNHDGLLDVMVMSQKGGKIGLQLFIQSEKGLEKANWDIEPLDDQPMIIDYERRMMIDLFGVRGSKPVIYKAVTGHENGAITGYKVVDGPSGMCKLKKPQYSAFADFDGDGQADILVICEDGSLEIWRNDAGKFVKGKAITLNFPADGPLVVADVNGDGSLDVIYYNSQSNSIYVLFNTQRKYCSLETEDESCKEKKQLFQYDPNYGFNSQPSISIKMADLFGSKDGWFGKHVEARLVTVDSNDVPLSLHAGDFDMDGYPDIVLVYQTADESMQKHAVLKNLHYNNTFVLLKEGTGDLDKITNAESIAFLPFTPNTRLPDVIVQTQDQKIFPFRNAFFRDTFFLQVEIMPSVCPKGYHKCRDLGAATERPPGTGLPGGTFMYNFADNNGISRVKQGNQVAQSAYLALPLPFMVFGLGRVSNFIEEAQAAISNQHKNISHRLTHLIPNSRLLIIPPRPPLNTSWHAELYINPSDYLLYVGLAAATIITLFGILTAIFKFREVREDKMERKRTLHAINFDAL